MYPESAYAIAHIAGIKHEMSQRLSHRNDEQRILSDARRPRWNTTVRGLGKHIVGHRGRIGRVAAVMEV
jgi:hypothetical protein